MWRVARPFLYLGTVAIVVGSGRYHAQFIGHYYFHSSQRLPWNLTYAAVLCVAAYGAGLPDLYRGVRGALWAALAATAAGAAFISMLQVLLGSLLLPRFVVAVAALVLVPWYVLCSLLATAGQGRQAGRDRVLCV